MKKILCMIFGHDWDCEVRYLLSGSFYHTCECSFCGVVISQENDFKVWKPKRIDFKIKKL